MKTPRIIAALVVALGAGTLVSACTTTQYNCQNSACTITLSGSGASTEPAGYTVELQGSDGQSADFSINGQAATCTEGRDRGGRWLQRHLHRSGRQPSGRRHRLIDPGAPA
ncbi:hypothetical protein [Sanguibacter sp. Z1732]|uniref:hypothetical protein n=1 Tax=Sanguibacter sp. Z1732 TaxID=3435412 RepID=UPI003D9C8C38